MNNNVTIEQLLSHKFVSAGLAILSALLNIAIFPRTDWHWLAWICFVPLLLLIPYRRPGRLFWLFLLAGFLFSAGNLYWIVHVIDHYTSVGMWLSAGVVALLCLIMGLFWAGFGALSGVVARRLGVAAALALAPFLWLAAEYGRNIVHFPWCLLGYSQYTNLRLCQLATFTGVYGLSWLIMAFNAGLVLALLLRRYFYLITSIVIIVAASLYGSFRIQQPAGSASLKVGVVQGNIPQDVKIDTGYADYVNRLHIRLTRELVASQKPDIVFWSESSTLYPLRQGGLWSEQVLALARETKTPILLGSDSYVDDHWLNSVFLVTGQGEIDPRVYSKIYLVPFGEYTPFSKILFFAGKVIPEISDFSGGTKYVQFPLAGRRFAVNVCFEVVFPQLSRRFTHEGASLLSTITNDAWFGRTAAPYQHWAQAIMRAIETRRYLVRAANTGISGFVDPYGRIIAQSDIFVTTTLAGNVRWVTDETFYSKHGDWLVVLSAVLSAIVVVFAIVRRPVRSQDLVTSGE